MAFKIALTLAAAYLLNTGSVIEKQKIKELPTSFATIEDCRASLRNDDATYDAIKRSVRGLHKLVDDNFPNHPLVRVSIRANCIPSG